MARGSLEVELKSTVEEKCGPGSPERNEAADEDARDTENCSRLSKRSVTGDLQKECSGRRGCSRYWTRGTELRLQRICHRDG